MLARAQTTRVAEFELPVTTLSESPVAFDASGRVTGVGDLSGNLISYSYDAAGNLTASADSQGRRCDVVWSGSTLSQVNWTGLGSSGPVAAAETGVVKYVVGASSLAVQRKTDAGTDNTLVTYGYTNGRIASVTDADGLTSTITYDAQGRVYSMTAPNGVTVAYDYAAVASGVRITTVGGSVSTTRDVRFDAATGCQPFEVTLDPIGPNAQTSSLAYDAYAHLKETTDPQGRKDRFTVDPHGNVTATTSNAGSLTADLVLSTSASYTNDRLASATDAMGNISYQTYDAKWRPLSSSVAVTNDSVGQAGVDETYNAYGNPRYGELPATSTDDLLENGTFEMDPAVAGNGWTLASGVTRVATSDTERPSHGNWYLNATYGFFALSDKVPVSPGETYQLSLWVKGAGTIDIAEWDSAGNCLRVRNVISTAVQSANEFTRASTAYVPTAGTAYASVSLGSYTGAVGFDNVRLEKANAAGTDNLLDNGSVERLLGSTPDGWQAVATAGDSAQSAGPAGGRYLLLNGATGSVSDNWWLSPVVPVVGGTAYTFATQASSQMIVVTQAGIESGARVEVSFFRDAAGTWPNEIARYSVTPNLTGSTATRRYQLAVAAPAGAVSVRYRVRLSQCSGWLFTDSFTVTSDSRMRETYDYDSSETYLTATTRLDGTVDGAEYDSRGRATQATHKATATAAATVESARTFDALDRLTSVVTAPASGLGISANFTYTAAGRLASVSDPLGRKTTLAYVNGKLGTVTTPTGIKTVTSYDGLGRIASVTAPYSPGQTAKKAVQFAYDSLGRVTSTSYFDSLGYQKASSSTTYDALSRPTRVAWTGEVVASADYRYDALGRMERLQTDGPAGATTSTFTFNKVGNPLSIAVSAFGGAPSSSTNVFAKTGQWLSTATTGGRTWEFTTGVDGTLRRIAERPATPEVAAAASRTLSYNAATQLVGVRLAIPGTVTRAAAPLADERIAYDSYGRVATDVLTSTQSALAGSHAYTYDAAGRLVSWSLNGAATTYAYDAAGNLTRADAPGTASDRTFTADAENRLTASKLGLTSSTYTSDAFGRRATKRTGTVTTTYTWDSVGHLTKIAAGTTTATYSYGATGMREQAKVVKAGVTTTTNSVWTGSQLTLERDSDGTLYRYVYGPGGLPLELIVTKNGVSTPYAYQCDRAGSVVGLTDAAGTLVASYRYDPWGSITATGGSNLTLANRNPLRYRGYYYDTVTALYYMPARYYDPATARFLSPDPAAPSAGDPLSLNRYAYCVGGPVNASDPSGAIPDVDGDGRVGPADVSIGRRSALRRSLLSTGRWNLAQSEREAQRYMAQIAR